MALDRPCTTCGDPSDLMAGDQCADCRTESAPAVSQTTVCRSHLERCFQREVLVFQGIDWSAI